MARTTTVRPVGSAETEAWLTLRRRLWPSLNADKNKVETDRINENPNCNAAFVALNERGSPSGFVEISIRDIAEGCGPPPIGYIEGWYVRPQDRRQGIGRGLIKAAEVWAASKGCREMASDTLLENVVGRDAHEKLDYSEISRLIHFRKLLSG